MEAEPCSTGPLGARVLLISMANEMCVHRTLPFVAPTQTKVRSLVGRRSRHGLYRLRRELEANFILRLLVGVVGGARSSVLLLLSSSLWRLSAPSPVGSPAPSPQFDRSTCKGLARSLLWNVMATLAVDHLFRGLNCTEQSAELHLRTQTLAVCSPQHSKCSDGRGFTFDQDACLQSVLEDLRQYRATFKAYSDRDHVLEQSVLKSIDDLMQNCFSATLLDSPQPLVSMEHENSFEGRLKLCKVLKAFHIRAVTINRVVNHILAVDSGVKE
ncbi:interleukin-12 subunit alpha [Salminus brasiliensis]|uniref:interleukin-12 subunit alpha n=1 Tax=Salminus brasiliensis TaxID=930266 RepID=UPI003B838546